MKASLLAFLMLFPTVCQAKPVFKDGVIAEKQPALKGKFGYVVAAHYPVFSAPIPAAANVAAKQIASAEVAEFKANYAKGDFAGPAAAWTLDQSYSLKYSNADVMSLLYVCEVWEGGAHPSHATHALMISPQTGRAFKLADCFRPGSPWLQLLSSYCIKQLKTREFLEAQSIASGAAPKAENYSEVLPKDKWLTVYFQEYQVGPYVAGRRPLLSAAGCNRCRRPPEGLPLRLVGHFAGPERGQQGLRFFDKGG